MLCALASAAMVRDASRADTWKSQQLEIKVIRLAKHFEGDFEDLREYPTSFIIDLQWGPNELIHIAESGIGLEIRIEKINCGSRGTPFKVVDSCEPLSGRFVMHLATSSRADVKT